MPMLIHLKPLQSLSLLLVILYCAILPIVNAVELTATVFEINDVAIDSLSVQHTPAVITDLSHDDIQEAARQWPGIVDDGSALAYEPSFLGVDRSLIGRANSPPQDLQNNTPVNDTVQAGTTNYYEFAISGTSRRILRRDEALMGDDEDDVVRRDGNYESSDKEGVGKRATYNGTVYITITTCSQPTYVNAESPPQLQLSISTTGNTQPGPNSVNGTQTRPLDEGYLEYTVNSTNNIYIGVTGPSAAGISGGWSYEIAASVDAPYHSYDPPGIEFFLIDTDSRGALLITKNLTKFDTTLSNETDGSQTPPLTLFILDSTQTTNGLRNSLQKSYCGLASTAFLSSTDPDSGITTGLTQYSGEAVEQQFHVPALSSSTSYTAILARPGKNAMRTPSTGSSILANTNFTTKTYANCALLYNLSFCDSVAYSAPANPSIPYALLASLYDNATQSSYQQFNYSLQQTPCNTTDTAKYSLARTCTDCAEAYKTWLCAVSIPRCADWTDPSQAEVLGGHVSLMPRNAAQTPLPSVPGIEAVTNSTLLDWWATSTTRNTAVIFEEITPGPYMEVLPCEDLCYEIIRSCPASFGFGCPIAGRGLEWSYGKRGGSGVGGGPSCSEPGAVWGVSGVGARETGLWWVGVGVVVVVVGVW